MSGGRGGGVRRLDRCASVPLWQQLREDLRGRLEAGEFATSFPGELELARQYSVSRYTVRAALRELRESGLVTAERGQAPRVAGAGEIEQPLGALYSLFASVEAAGMRQRSVVRALDLRADAVAAEHLVLEASTPLLYLERLRLADDQPLAVDRVWLPANLAAPLLGVDFGHTALYGELAARCGVRLTGGHETLRAVVPTPAEARLLQVDERCAAFAIHRLGCVREQPVEWRHTLIRGDRFSLLAQFSARGGYTFGAALPEAGRAAQDRLRAGIGS